MQQRKSNNFDEMRVTQTHAHAGRKLKTDIARTIGELKVFAEQARYLFKCYPTTHELGQAALFLGLAEDDSRQALEWARRLSGVWMPPQDDIVTVVTRPPVACG